MIFAGRAALCVGRVIGCFGLLFAIVRGGSEACAQMPSRVERFGKIVQELYASGVKVERSRAVVWFLTQEMPSSEREPLADDISNGIDEIERLLRLSFGPTPLEYFVTREFGVTSTYYPGPPPRVFLALSRVKSGDAPYLHEAVHHLVFRYAKSRASSVHMWLLEGFPNFVQGEIAERAGRGREGWMIVGNQRVDAEAHKIMATPVGRGLVSFVGRTGAPPNLETEREEVARPYYVLAQSFTKHLVDTISLRPFATKLIPLMLNSARFEAMVYELTGKTVEQLRLEWLGEITRSNEPRRRPAPFFPQLQELASTLKPDHSGM